MAIPGPWSGCRSWAWAKMNRFFVLPPFINSEGLEVQGPGALNYFSQNEWVTINAKVSVMALVRFRYTDSHMIFCARQVVFVQCNSLNSFSTSCDKGECPGSSPVFTEEWIRRDWKSKSDLFCFFKVSFKTKSQEMSKKNIVQSQITLFF